MTYYDKIKHNEEIILEMLLTEAPHTSFHPGPPEFDFLTKGMVDLGFENLGIDPAQIKTIYKAYTQTGVKIPGTSYKMVAESGMKGRIIPISQSENIPELPSHWMECVMVVSFTGNDVLFAGKRVRPDQLP